MYLFLMVVVTRLVKSWLGRSTGLVVVVVLVVEELRAVPAGVFVSNSQELQAILSGSPLQNLP